MKFPRSRPTLLLALLLPILPALAQEGGAEPAGRVSFQASVSSVLPNDELHAVLYTERSEKDAGQLSRVLTREANEALRLAKGWPSVKVSTGNQSSWPIYDKANKLTGWRGRTDLNISSRDFKAAGEVLAALQDRLTLQGVQFMVAEDTRANAESRLTGEAIAAFRQKAAAVTKAWGAPGYDLLQLDVGNEGESAPRLPVMMMAKMAMADAAPAPELAAGESRLVVRVSGAIRLKP